MGRGMRNCSGPAPSVNSLPGRNGVSQLLGREAGVARGPAVYGQLSLLVGSQEAGTGPSLTSAASFLPPAALG